MSNFLYFIFYFYLALVSVNLFFCFHQMEGFRRITKVFLMPCLALSYYLGCPKEKFSKIILFALLFGCLGDIFIIIKNLFILGVASFLLKNYKKHIFVFLAVCLVYFYAENKVLDYFKPALIKAGLWGPLFVYTSILATLNISSAIYAYCYTNLYSILTYLGSLIFAISDIILAQQLFMKYNKYHQIFITITYILGQSLISLGMANKKDSFELDGIKKII